MNVYLHNLLFNLFVTRFIKTNFNSNKNEIYGNDVKRLNAI